MRIVLLIPKLHAGTELALNKLVKRKDLEIVGILRSDISPFQKSYWKYISYGLRRAGLFYGLIIGLFAYLHTLGLVIASLLIWNRRRNWLYVRQIVKKYKIDLYDCKSVNSRKSIKKLKSWNPDVLVTVYFDQILKKPVIDIPKKAALNMHPGILPQYRGLWPVFWKLYNGDKFAGVTIHHLNEKIDDGDIVAQLKFPIKKDDNRFSLGLKSARKGGDLLIATLLKMKKGVKLPKLKIKGVPKYYSLPNKKQFEEFYARGKRMFTVRGMWRDLKALF